ncbi:MAG TPA: ABC transporter permease [Candidatus Paceibacterota bacterium]|nr:ABC transporter permease [Candidatus Paceibacterota bacterium]
MSPYRMWISYYTMIRKEFIRMIRIWSQTLLPPIVTTSLYFVVFGSFIGRQLATIHGFSYMQFIVPGLIMMSVITSSYMNTVSTFYFAKWQRNIDEILVSPTPNWVVIAGFVSGGMLRGLLVGFLVLLVSLFFTHLVIYNIFVLLAAVILTSMTLSLAGLVNGIFAKGFDGISIVPTFVLTPLTYLGGVFYSVNQFTPFWHTVSLFNPILYIVNAFRYGFLGVSDVSVAFSLSMLVALVAILLTVTVVFFNRGVGFKN